MRSRASAVPAVVVATVILAGYSWWVTGLAPFSGVATVAVLLGGAVAAAAGVKWGRARRAASPSRNALLPWGGWAVAVAAWQLMAWSRAPRGDNPTLSSLANGALEPRPLRALALAVWLAGAAWWAG